jgi:hypothetical protein
MRLGPYWLGGTVPWASALVLLAVSFGHARDFKATHGERGQRLLLKSGWGLKSSQLAKEDGDAISTPQYKPGGWYAARVPATVLSTLIRNGVYPDVRVGLNALKIPDASDEFNRKYDLVKYSYLPGKRNPWKDPYWYRTEFSMPKTASTERVWLHFDCINYRAEVWLNGAKIAGRDQMAGMFQRFRFDISSHAKAGQNALAVKIFPVDHPGEPEAQLDVFGKDRGYFKEIMKDVTEVMTIGYDCMATVPDRNMGICQDVWVEFTGPVAIRNPFVVTDLPLPKTDRATLTISAELVNATEMPIKGILRGRTAACEVQFEQPVELGPQQTKVVAIDPKPVMNAPRLWWPVNYGPQNLYELALTFETGGIVSDQRQVTFGVRRMASELYAKDGWHGRRVFINGQRVFCRGGYIQPELLLDWDARRIEAEIRYYASANLNFIYFEDIPNPPTGFLELCDKYGLMFGNCFYACGWPAPGSGNPADMGLLECCTVDLVKRYRNHPSLIMYMPMNEADTREEVYELWRKHVIGLDGTRFLIPSAYFPEDRKDVPPWVKKDLPAGMTDKGPQSYTWQEPSTYYAWVRNNRNWMFMMEACSASLPPISSLARFLPEVTGKGRSPKNPDREGPAGPFPLNGDWAHHGANHYYKDYDQALRRLHGEPATVADYCWKGHLVTADQHRAMFEAVHHRMWDITSGFTQWKINSSFPDVQWQIFDWYHKPMVSYYYIKRACEPVHVQLGLLEPMVSVINHRFQPQPGLQVRARVYDANMKLRWEKRLKIDVAANSYVEAFTIPDPADLTPIYFVRLDLEDARERHLSDNFYWLPAKKGGDQKALDALPLVALRTSTTAEVFAGRAVLHVRVENPNDHLAFFVQLASTRGPGGPEILPILWDDNYFSLLPHESREITTVLTAAESCVAKPEIEVGGWNIATPFQCGQLAVSTKAARADEPLTVSATVAKTFLDGSRVTLFVDDRPASSQFVWARGNSMVDAQFTIRLPAGRHKLRVGENKVSIEVR